MAAWFENPGSPTARTRSSRAARGQFCSLLPPPAVVELLPTWLAPNLITLLGTVGALAGWAALAWHCPALAGDAPRWAYAANAILSVVYLHLDCLDGKQARRTGSSSPLGQLFDHGCDALVLVWQVTGGLMATGAGAAGPPALALAGAVVGFLVWMVSHWEEYHTGTMVYGGRWWGLTESLYSLAAVSMVTAVVGPDLWRTPLIVVPAALAPPLLAPPSITLASLATVLAAVAAMPQIVGVLRRTLASASERSSSSRRDGDGDKELGLMAAVSQLGALVGMVALGALLVHGTPRAPAWPPAPTPGVVGAGSAADPARAVVLLHLSTWGVHNALQASRLIVAHMCKVPFRPSRSGLAILAGYLLLREGGGISSSSSLAAPAALFAVLTGVYAHYISVTISELRRGLGLRAVFLIEDRTRATPPSRRRKGG